MTRRLSRFGPRVHDVVEAPRVLIIGDVQGNGEGLRALLQSAGYAQSAPEDGTMEWTGQDSALVFVGDLVDGGVEPAEVIWLVMSLKEQAESAGGMVLLLAGNHELMMLDALRAPAALDAVSRWAANGGLETLARLANRMGHAVPQPLIERIFAPLAGLDEIGPEVVALRDAVAAEYAPERAFIEEQARPAALVNGCVLVVHAAPDFEAESLAAFGEAPGSVVRLAWDRSWLAGAQGGRADDGLKARMQELKKRLEASEDVRLRHVAFGHTCLAGLEIDGFRRQQYAIGRLLERDDETPALYDVITAPRALPRNGALGGLEISGEGVRAIYGRELAVAGGAPKTVHDLGPGDPAFR
jgi:hypothetical protein